MSHRRAAVVLVCSALAVAAGAQAAPATETGLRGTLFVYPSQPVCPRGASCTKPAPGLTLAFFRNGRRIARSTTNRLGRYRVLLAPGTYTVKLWRRPAVPIQPARVAVPRAAIRRVDFTYDSGIR